MKRTILSSLAIILISTLAMASPATSRNVSYKSGNEAVHAALYTPAGTGPFPALVVIHEWDGLNDWVKEQAQKLADQGYVALAVDLYRGKVAKTPEEAHELMRGLPQDRGLRDLRAEVEYLGSQKNVNAKKIGAIGWCMGGGWALNLAEHEATLAAAVVNYGNLSSDDESLKPINAAILGSFGAQDRGIPPQDVKKFEQQMKALGKRVEVKIYADAGHRFENETHTDTYRAQDAEDAWRRTVAFLQE